VDIALQHMLFQVLNQRAADPVRNALGFAGSARRIQHVERIVEAARHEIDALHQVGEDLAPVNGIDVIAESGKPDLYYLLDARQLRANIPGFVVEIVAFAVIKITVGRKQETRLGLAEAIDHAVDAEVGRSRGPDRAETGGG
jgi:hypothetical protein